MTETTKRWTGRGRDATLLVALALIPVLLWRLLDEERFLKQNLPGYADYCRITSFMLIPLIW